MSHNNHDFKTMWLMMIFCALPLVILLFSGRATGDYGWFAILAIAAFAIGHFWLMRKEHGKQEGGDMGRAQEPKEYSHH